MIVYVYGGPCTPLRAWPPRWHHGMERVLGIGGYFIRASDPAALGGWYRDCLGLDADDNGVWHQEAGPTVFAPFEVGTDYFGSRSQQTMLNLRVRDLDTMLTQLRGKGNRIEDYPKSNEKFAEYFAGNSSDSSPTDHFNSHRLQILHHLRYKVEASPPSCQ